MCGCNKNQKRKKRKNRHKMRKVKYGKSLTLHRSLTSSSFIKIVDINYTQRGLLLIPYDILLFAEIWNIFLFSFSSTAISWLLGALQRILHPRKNLFRYLCQASSSIQQTNTGEKNCLGAKAKNSLCRLKILLGCELASQL